MHIRTIFIHSLWALVLLFWLSFGVDAAQAQNTLLGTGAGASLTTGNSNTLLGENAGNAITTDILNTLVGNEAGPSATGSYNTMVGSQAGFFTTTGDNNAFFGAIAGPSNTTGYGNTYLGFGAGFNNQTGVKNLFVGYLAGANELGSFKLYIDNSSTSAPLVYGEFDNDVVGINGALGVGTQIPMDQLHVYNGNLRIEQAGATHAILNFVANGKAWEIKNNEATGRLTFFSPGGGASTASFKFDRQAVENLLRVGVLAADTVDINGNLVVAGFLNPDYVFTPEYPLETIDDHAASMWQHRHLPAVGPGQVNAQGQAMVNVGLRSQGMLEELEKAHLYIDQLHEKKNQNEAALVHVTSAIERVQEDNASKGQRMAALMREVRVDEAQLAVLNRQMIEKEGQLAKLQEEVTTLEALIQQLMGHNPDAGPGKES